jgi:hypothetical protein
MTRPSPSLRRLRTLKAYLKHQGRPRSENAKAPRDKWALSISLLSIIISFGTLFFSFLLQRDHISIAVANIPEAMRAADGSVSLLVFFDPEITFINSGNRPAAITYFAATAKLLAPGAPRRCNGQELGNIYTLPISIPNVVLKPGEITPVRVQIPKKDKGDSIDVPTDIYRSKPGDELLVCLQFDVVTPDSVSRVRTVPATLVTFDAHFGDDLNPEGRPTNVLTGRRDGLRVNRFAFSSGGAYFGARPKFRVSASISPATRPQSPKMEGSGPRAARRVEQWP